MEKDFVTLNGKKVEIDTNAVVTTEAVYLSDMNSDIAQQSGTYTWYSVLASRLKYELDVLEEEQNHLVAQIELRTRKIGIPGIKRTTDKAVQANVTVDERYRKLKLAYLDKKLEYDIVMSIVKGLAQRKDMLQTLSANLRRDFDNED